MSSNKDSLNESKDNISIADIVRIQDSIKKEVDFEKPDNELTVEEQARKILYFTFDEQIEKVLGEDSKREFDQKRNRVEKVNQFQTNLNKLFELGKEIEKNFVWQSAYLVHHFNKTGENYYFTATRNLTDQIVEKNDVSSADRVSKAKNVIEITKAYRSKMESDIVTKQEIMSALIQTFENLFNKTDFGIYSESQDGNEAAEHLKVQFSKWLNLSKELLPYRQKAINAVSEDIDLDEILPTFVIENNGDISKNVSGVELGIKGKRVVRQITEANNAEKDIGEKRSKIAEDLYGSPDTYMDFGTTNNEVPKTVITKQNPLESKPWFRLAKVIYVLTLSLGLLLSFIFMAEDADSGFWLFVVVIVLSIIVRKSFYYVTLGKTDWRD